MLSRMLYEFHTRETAKKPKSVHATYLLTGKKGLPGLDNNLNGRDGDDIIMRSSPFMSSLPAPEGTQEKPVSKMSIVLVREEELESTSQLCNKKEGTRAKQLLQKPRVNSKRSHRFTSIA